MRVLVCGGRAFSDADYLNQELAAFHAETPITELIEGGATGADRLARNWAQSLGIKVLTYHANWVGHGKAAGPIRNRLMLTDGQPDWVIAFAGGRGTANMIKQAQEFGCGITALKHKDGQP